jgi:tocopherol cyclase
VPGRLLRAYRASGADGPFGRPERAHGVPFEGYYWRIVQPGTGRVLVALGAACRDAAGTWGMATLAAHPGGLARTVTAAEAEADPSGFGLRVGDALHGAGGRVVADLGAGARLDARLEDPEPFPRRALGLAHLVPGLHQYWQPVVLRARVTGSAELGGERIDLSGALAYAEKNWAHSFPDHWWWGHAAAFPDPEVSAAFAGGHVRLAGAAVSPTAVAVALGGEVLALAPPLARTRVALGPGRWRLRTRAPGLVVELEGEAEGPPHVLDVPVPGERRTEPRSEQHLAGTLTLTVRRGRRLAYRGASPLAGLELGRPLLTPPPAAPPR